MAEQNNKLNNISVFKFFEMTLQEFKDNYAGLSDAAQKTLDESICFIHPAVAEGQEDEGNGYMYAHGKYYNMSLDARDLNKVLTTGYDEEDVVPEVIKKNPQDSLSPMERIRLRTPAIEWIEIDTDEPNSNSPAE